MRISEYRHKNQGFVASISCRQKSLACIRSLSYIWLCNRFTTTPVTTTTNLLAAFERQVGPARVGKKSFSNVMEVIFGDVADVTEEGGVTTLTFTDPLKQTQHIFTLEV